jgi:hypothetical protein
MTCCLRCGHQDILTNKSIGKHCFELWEQNFLGPVLKSHIDFKLIVLQPNQTKQLPQQVHTHYNHTHRLRVWSRLIEVGEIKNPSHHLTPDSVICIPTK